MCGRREVGVCVYGTGHHHRQAVSLEVKVCRRISDRIMGRRIDMEIDVHRASIKHFAVQKCPAHRKLVTLIDPGHA